MRSFFIATFLSLTVGLAAPLVAQQASSKPSDWRVTLAPRFGMFLPDKGMGESEVQGATLTMTRSPTAGLDIELRTPVRWLSMRAIAETSVGSRLSERGTTADAACTTTCERIVQETAIGESSVVTLVGDALVRPWSERRAQPFLFGGGGVKRYDISHNRFLAGGPESAFTFHFGGGLDVPLGPIALSFEAADYVSRQHAAIRPATGSIFIDTPAPESSTLKHDYFLTLGVRLFPH